MDNTYSNLKELAGDFTLLYADSDFTLGEKLLPVLRYFFKEVDFVFSCNEALNLYQQKNMT